MGDTGSGLHQNMGATSADDAARLHLMHSPGHQDFVVENRLVFLKLPGLCGCTGFFYQGVSNMTRCIFVGGHVQSGFCVCVCARVCVHLVYRTLDSLFGQTLICPPVHPHFQPGRLVWGGAEADGIHARWRLADSADL